MTPCPADGQLQLLIDDQLSPMAEGALTAHVDTCTACQERLERLTRSAELPGSVPPDLLDASTTLVERWTRNRPQTAESWPQVKGYEILGELGRGGMGVVYRAWQAELKRTVALKMILAGAHADARVLARFRTEAEAAARLQHPNIVQVHDVGEHDGCPCLILEYIDGTNLARQIDGTPQPAPQAARLAETLARAVHYAHQQGVVHRDLKPANVLLQKSEIKNPKSERGGHPGASDFGFRISDLELQISDFTPKVSDFGLAKLLAGGAAQTQSGEVMGTPSYMAPEQAAGKAHEAGPATDVYALGAILYELLTGRPPFKAETPLETVWQVIQEEPVSVTRLQPKVPRDLETICLKCLQKEPGKRYASAAALADDLGRFLAGEPIRARRVRAWERGVKWARRRPAWAALAVVSLTATVGLIGGGIWYNTRLKDEVRQRKAQHDRAVAHLQTAIDVLEHELAGLHDAQQRGFDVPTPLRGDLLEHAGAFYERLLAEDADDPAPPARRAIGRAYFGLGLSTRMQINPTADGQTNAPLVEQARDYYRKAILVQETLLAAAPDAVDYRIDLAVTLLKLMELQPAGPEHYQTRKRLVSLVQALPPDHPRLADMGTTVANELADRGRLREALPWLEQHTRRLETLRGRTQPGRNLNAMNRAVYGLYVTRAVLLHELGEYARALDTWDRVLALGEVPGASPDTADVRLHRALTLIHLGNPEQAVREAEQAVGAAADGRRLLMAAAVVSLAAGAAHQDPSRSASEQASLADQYGARAVALLRLAQAAGWFAKPDQLDKLKTDPDFAPLRARNDFQKLLTEVESAAQPMP